MLNARDEIDALLAALNIPRAGVQYVTTVRTSPPARRVRSSTVANCCYRYVSKRMGCAMMAESHLEYMFLLRCEFGDTDLLEYWEQPPSIPIEGETTRARRYRAAYTADVLTIQRGGIFAYEIKPAEICERLCERRPRDWKRSKGGFIYRPALEAFKQLGISHLVVTDQELDRVEISNYELLMKTRSPAGTEHERGLQQIILREVATEQCLTIGALQRRIGIKDIAPIIRLIDCGELACDLSRSLLTAVEDVWVAIDTLTLKRARKGMQLVAGQGDLDIPCTEVPSSRQAIELVSRLDVLKGMSPPGVCARTVRHWRALQRAGGNQALVPKKHLRGNRSSRLSFAHEELVHACLNRFFLNADSWKPFRCYGAYLHSFKQATALKEAGERPISLPSFLHRVRRVDPEIAAMARGGKRARNAASPPVDPRSRAILATHPFHRAHVDHANLDIHLNVMDTGGRKLVRRPWLTLMTDEYTGAVLAMSLSFRPPSRRSCSLVLRDCAMRHERLPECIVVDNGKEFESVYFEACLARLGVNKQSRPPGHPRYGSTVERTFGVLKEELLLTLPGNAGNLQEDRGKSTSHKGWKHSKLSLLDLHELLVHYFFEHFNHHASCNQLRSPNAAMEEGLEQLKISGVPTAFNWELLVTTAIEVSKPPMLDPQRGLKHNNLFYSNPVLRTLGKRVRVEAREEPWDHRCLYILVKHQWQACFHGPRPSASSITLSSMCNSMTWLDSSDLRQKARIDRLVAAHEMRTSAEWIRSENAEEAKERTQSKARKARKTPPATAPSSPIDTPPLSPTDWEEA